MVEDVGNGKVVGERGPDQREGGGAGGEEGGDAGAACRLRKALGRDAGVGLGSLKEVAADRDEARGFFGARRGDQQAVRKGFYDE